MKNMLLAIAKDVAGFFVTYAPAGCILAGIVTLLCYLFCDRTKVKRLWVLFLLVFYLYVVLGITILSRSEGSTRQISLELFRTFRNTFYARKQIYENVMMFVPLSVLLYMLTPLFRRIKIVLAMGVGASFLIELTQWITMTGHFELDDILTNTIGMLCGYMLCVIIEKLAKWIKSK